MFLPWVEQVAEDETKELASRLKEVLDDASETDERYKQLKTDCEKAKERYEAYQLKTANTDKQTLKTFKKAVAVAVLEVAVQTVSLFFLTVFLCFLIFPHVFRYLIVVCGCSSLCFFSAQRAKI